MTTVSGASNRNGQALANGPEASHRPRRLVETSSKFSDSRMLSYSTLAGLYVTPLFVTALS